MELAILGRWKKLHLKRFPVRVITLPLGKNVPNLRRSVEIGPRCWNFDRDAGRDGELYFSPDRNSGKIRRSVFPPSFRHCVHSQPLEMDKFSGPLGEQLEAHALYLQNFITRFFELIDPESGPVKGPVRSTVVALTFS